MNTNPVLKQRLIVIEYWDCGLDGHQHSEKTAAVACMEKQARAQAAREAVRFNYQVRAQLLARHEAGTPIAELARQLGLSSSRVREVIAQAQSDKHQAAQFHGDGGGDAAFVRLLESLTTRSRTCMITENCKTLEDVRAVVRRRDIPNFGEKSRREVLDRLKDLERGEAQAE